MTSNLTIVRNRIIQEFETLKKNESGRVVEFEVSRLWLTETETKRASTYCIWISGETRKSSSHEEDLWQIDGRVIVWAHDTTDAQEKLYEMIEDAREVLKRAFQALTGTVITATHDEWEGPDPTTITKDWAQALIPWSCTHRRAGMV